MALKTALQSLAESLDASAVLELLPPGLTTETNTPELNDNDAITREGNDHDTSMRKGDTTDQMDTEHNANSNERNSSSNNDRTTTGHRDETNRMTTDQNMDQHSNNEERQRNDQDEAMQDADTITTAGDTRDEQVRSQTLLHAADYFNSGIARLTNPSVSMSRSARVRQQIEATSTQRSAADLCCSCCGGYVLQQDVQGASDTATTEPTAASKHGSNKTSRNNNAADNTSRDTNANHNASDKTRYHATSGTTSISRKRSRDAASPRELPISRTQTGRSPGDDAAEE